MQELVSGEGVVLDLPLAGPGSRAVAAVLDLLVQVMVLVVLSVAASAVLSGGDVAAATALGVVLVVAVLGGYPVLSEWLSGGRTLGKAVMGLRVVRDDAGPIGFRQALVRGISSLVLEKPGLLVPVGTAAGFLTASGSSSWKRLGDLLAGTVVVQDRRADPVAVPPLLPPPALWGWAAGLDLSRLDDDLALSARRFVARARAVSPAARHDLEQRLAAAVADRVAPPPPPGVPAEVYLVTVLAERRRRAGFGRPGGGAG